MDLFRSLRKQLSGLVSRSSLSIPDWIVWDMGVQTSRVKQIGATLGKLLKVSKLQSFNGDNDAHLAEPWCWMSFKALSLLAQGRC